MPIIRDEPPRSILPATAAIAAWAARPANAASGQTWRMIMDSDGAIGLIAQGSGTATAPPLLIMPGAQGGFEVTVCDPGDPIELGSFGSIEAALGAITGWLATYPAVPFSGSA